MGRHTTTTGTLSFEFEVLTFYEGDLGNLTCFVSPLTPTNLVDWHFDGEQITQGRAVLSKRYNVYRTDIDAISLFIYPIEANDTGRYLCVEHENGEINEFDVYVNSECIINGPSTNPFQNLELAIKFMGSVFNISI
ncbi:hypothetical protein ACOME3_005720 [Neoechinorhynchus agilis]